MMKRMQSIRYVILFFVIIGIDAGCFAQNNKKTSSQKIINFCDAFERHVQVSDFDQRFHAYLLELYHFLDEDKHHSLQQKDIQQDIKDAERFFQEMPFRVGMSTTRVQQIIEQRRFLVSEFYQNASPPQIRVLAGRTYPGEVPNLWSSVWIDLTIDDDVVKSICIAPGNLSGILPGFLFDDVKFQKKKEEKDKEEHSHTKNIMNIMGDRTETCHHEA